MTPEPLEKRVDLKKLTPDDFILKGALRVTNEHYHGWKIKPEFKPEGTDAYVPLDQLFPEDKFHSCYELIVQTPDYSEVMGSGYLHRSARGDISFGIRHSEIEEQERAYFSSLPVWVGLLAYKHEEIMGRSIAVDLIFVKVSPRHSDSERDVQRQRVLGD